MTVKRNTKAIREAEATIVAKSAPVVKVAEALSTPAVKATDVSVRELAEETAKKHGSLSQALANVKSLAERMGRNDDALRAWYTVATEAKSARMTERDFGAATGSSKNTLPRLYRGARIVAAYAAKGVNVSATMVQSFADRTTETEMTGVLSAIRKGESDPIRARVERKAKAVAAKKEGREQGSPAKSTKPETVAVQPKDYASVLELIRLRADEIPAKDRARALESLKGILSVLEAGTVRSA